MTERIRFPGAFNFRQLGGTDVDGGVIEPDVLYRSDLIIRQDPDRADQVLSELGITTVIDLRTAGELETDGSIASSSERSVSNVSILKDVWSWDDEHAADSIHFHRDKTIDMYETRSAQIFESLELIAASPRAALFHCTAGKDRTGALSSVLLGLLGASRGTIVADYARSAEGIAEMAEWYRAQNELHAERGDDEKNLLERAAMPLTMEGSYDFIDERYGTYLGWANHFGVDSGLVRKLRSKLVR